MITINHIIDHNYIEKNDRIEITLNYDKEIRIILLNNKRKIYINKE